MKMSNVISLESCKGKNIFNDFNSMKGKSYFNAIAMKNIFSKYGLSFTEENVEEELNLTLSEDLFVTREEKNLNNKVLKEKLLRFKKHEDLIYPNVDYRKASTKSVFIDKQEIKVDYHFIRVNHDEKQVTVVKVKNKKNPFKAKGRTPLTSVSKSKELFLLQCVGMNEYPTYTAYGSIVHLSTELDKNEVVDPSYDFTTTLAIKSFSDKEISKMEKETIELINNPTSSCSASACSTCSANNICNYLNKGLEELKVIPPVKKASSNVEFSIAQQKFIEVRKGVHRILACAGSGKTTVTANHVLELISNGFSPKDILLITFTNKGVEEMKEKIFYWTKVKGLSLDINDFNIFTFNGFGYDLIKKEYEFLGYTKEPTVLDRVEKMEILKNLINKYPKVDSLNYLYPFMDLPNSKGAVIKLGTYLDDIKRFGLSYDFEIEEEFDLSDKDAKIICDIFKEYNNILKESNLIEFNDQIPLAYKILSNEDLLKKYGFLHIICDEFQDSDTSQINLLYLLYKYKYLNSLTVCGDDSQSIFSWRGANQENITRFNKFFPDVEDISMLENFRSTKQICDLANYIDEQNEETLHKDIFSSKKGKLPKLIEGDYNTICKLVEEDINKGYNPHELTIISRNKSTLLNCKNLLTKNNIPNLITTAEQLIDNSNIKNIIGFSNFLLDNTMDLHFAEYLQIAKYEEFKKVMGDKAKLTKFIEDEKSVFLGKYLSLTTDKEQINFFYELLEELSSKDLCIGTLLGKLKEKNFTNIASIVKYLNKLVLYKSDLFVEKTDSIYDAVNLITAHSSKGKEYNKVFIDLNKFDKVDTATNSLNESLRLLFVAVTRAKKELVIVGKKSNKFFKLLSDSKLVS